MFLIVFFNIFSGIDEKKGRWTGYASERDKNRSHEITNELNRRGNEAKEAERERESKIPLMTPEQKRKYSQGYEFTQKIHPEGWNDA